MPRRRVRVTRAAGIRLFSTSRGHGKREVTQSASATSSSGSPQTTYLPGTLLVLVADTFRRCARGAPLVAGPGARRLVKGLRPSGAAFSRVACSQRPGTQPKGCTWPGRGRGQCGRRRGEAGGRLARAELGAGSTPATAGRGQGGRRGTAPSPKLRENFEARGSEAGRSAFARRSSCPSVARLSPGRTAFRPRPRGERRWRFPGKPDRLDPATAGNDAGASTAPAPGGEGEPHSRHRDARLGSTDKELKAGTEAADSARTAPGTPWQRGPRVKVMDAAGGPRILLPRPCRVLVLLNPRGGKGKGLQLFRSHVQPLLVQADISFTLMLTDRRNHARELVRAEDLRLWDALVIMSGDGLMHEVVNGLMERPDWETAMQKPLCSLPAGSGNALAASLNHYAGYEQVTNEDLLTNCTRLLCRRVLSPMDLLSLQTASGLRVFSVLSLTWGFIADVDLESEKFRGLGEMRFTLGTFLRLVTLRTYRGRLAYLPVETVVSKMPPASAPAQWAQQGPVDTHLVPLEEPVPSHWTVVPEQDFVLVLALLHSHLGSEMFAAPMGRCTAGAMHLFYVRAGVSRAMLLRLFLAMEKGRHMECECPHLVYVPVVAFRLEPKDGKGVFAVDGEMLVSEAVQGQVHPNYFWMVSGCSESLPSREPQPSLSQKPQQRLPREERS